MTGSPIRFKYDDLERHLTHFKQKNEILYNEYHDKGQPLMAQLHGKNVRLAREFLEHSSGLKQ